MTSPAASQILDLADFSGWQTCVAKTRNERGDDGQFFSPPAIARGLASWFQPDGFNRPSVHLLDPGAGGGVLTAAVVDRITALRAGKALPKLKEVTLEVWELDEAFLPTLTRNLSVCEAALKQAGVQTIIQLHHGSYIEGGVRALDPGLFGVLKAPEVTHAILNPPYRKIATRSKERIQLASIGMETSNLYAAFVWLALRQLAPGGELAAITPRSFCNGPYFREFRRELLELATFHRVHVFNSRTEAFSRDKVLQENILFHLSRDTNPKAPLTVSTGSLTAPEKVHVARDRFVSLSDPDRVIHIATESDANDIRTFFDALPAKLTELGIEVSTGPVVDFRLKGSLADHLGAGGVPLIYPHCVKTGHVLVPRRRAKDYTDARISKKPVAILDDAESRKWLIPAARFILIKRFSSKEEKRRLVAGVLDPADFPSGLLGIENHLNFFHRKRAGLSESLARGLCRFLNSTVADRYFRQFNGHTQVNVSDLRSFRYPDLPALERLGKATLDDTQQSAIDLAMTKHLGAPSFTDS
jgi:adenine-specific DNA-methyltransferase